MILVVDVRKEVAQEVNIGGEWPSVVSTWFGLIKYMMLVTYHKGNYSQEL